MRIVLVTHTVDFQDGQGRVNYEVVQGALAAGHSVTVVGERCSAEIIKHPLATFVPMGHSKLPTRILKDLWFAQESARWLRKHRDEFDLVQVNGFVTWEPADVAAVHFVHSAWIMNAAYPFQWASLSPYAYYQRIYTMLNARFERRAFKSAKKVIAVSSFTAGEIASLGIPADRISVVYNGVNTEEFKPGVPERESFGLPDGVPLMFFVGDIRTKRKNLEAVLHAMQSFPEVHLAVAGKVVGSPYPAMADELKVSDRVHFLGTTSRVAALMRSCDVFVFPSRYEAQPLVLLEALASGLPVVVSNNFRAQDYIGDGGIVYGEADDLPALTAVLETVLRSSAKRGAMQEAARKRALEMQWSKTATGYLAVYEELVAKR